MSAELPLFLVMVGGYAFGATGALVSATARSARRLSAAGAIIGAGASVALAATVMPGGGPWDLSVRALLGVSGV